MGWLCDRATKSLPAVDLRISGACSDARIVRTVCSKALSAMLVASAMVMAEPPTALDNTSCTEFARQNSPQASQLRRYSRGVQEGSLGNQGAVWGSRGGEREGWEGGFARIKQVSWCSL